MTIKTNEIQSIWGCIEMSAAARGFDYENYICFHIRTGNKGKPLSEVNYKKVADILNTDIDEHMTGR